MTIMMRQGLPRFTGIPIKDKAQKIILFGASGLGKAYSCFLLKNGFRNLSFCDNSPTLSSNVGNMEVLRPMILAAEHLNARIIITSCYWKEISQQLYALGLGKEFTYVERVEKDTFAHHRIRIIKERRALSFIKLFSKCPICRTRGIRHFMHNGTRNLYRCKKCDHFFTFEFMNTEEFEESYQGEKYFFQNCTFQGINSISDDSEWRPFCETRLRALRVSGISPDSLSGRSVLEIGCLEGRFLHHLKTFYDCKVLGVDVNRDITHKAMETLGIKILTDNIETTSALKHNEFDMALMFHVLEHVKFPVGVIKKVHESLREGGRILVEVPNGKTEPYTPDHYHFFSRNSLRKTLENCFHGVRIREDLYRDRAGVSRGSLHASAFK